LDAHSKFKQTNFAFAMKAKFGTFLIFLGKLVAGAGFEPAAFRL
jgi:hypothetical protein